MSEELVTSPTCPGKIGRVKRNGNTRSQEVQTRIGHASLLVQSPRSLDCHRRTANKSDRLSSIAVAFTGTCSARMATDIPSPLHQVYSKHSKTRQLHTYSHELRLDSRKVGDAPDPDQQIANTDAAHIVPDNSRSLSPLSELNRNLNPRGHKLSSGYYTASVIRYAHWPLVQLPL